MNAEICIFAKGNFFGGQMKTQFNSKAKNLNFLIHGHQSSFFIAYTSWIKLSIS